MIAVIRDKTAADEIPSDMVSFFASGTAENEQSTLLSDSMTARDN